MFDVIIIGGGAAGMMAAVQAGFRQKKVALIDKNTRLGKKIMITGKGRCNITNSAPIDEFIEQIPGNGRFLYSALYSFDNQAVLDFLAGYGLETKVERGGRVFPTSDRSQDVIDAFIRGLAEAGVNVMLNREVKAITRQNETFTVSTQQDDYHAAKVVIATGGVSYPLTGSSGDGYRWARQLGHTIVPPKPALVPLVTKEPWVRELQGLSLRNVLLSAWNGKRKLGEEFGEMLFTHYGVSGPIVLTLSRNINEALVTNKDKIILQLNLKPALTSEQLDKRIVRDFEKYSRKQFKNALDGLLPKLLIPVVIGLSQIDSDKFIHQITQAERQQLVELMQNLSMTVESTRPLKEAIVTSGGVSVKEVDPSTMESKLVTGLFFAGEVIDVDGNTGGYNLQAAWSTGYLAGINV